MITSRGKASGHVKPASPASAKDAAPFFAAAPTAVTASKTSYSSNDGHNPLINDLLKDLDKNSFPEDVHGAGHVQEQNVSNANSFSNFDLQLRRPSEESTASCRSSARNRDKTATDILCKTGQHFVHAMRMHKLEDFFCPAHGESAEDVLRRQLRKKDQEEVEAVVLTLVELLEEVRKARSQLVPLAGSLSLLDTSGRKRTSFNSMHSAVSTASLMRPPVHETNQLAMAYDQQGNRMINCYRVIANLGRGAYGKVKLGVDTNTGQMVAIKIIDKKLLKRIGGLGSSNQEAALKREIAIMKKVRHRNCVSLYEVIDDPDSHILYLIMEYVPNGPVVRLKPQELSSTALESIEAGIPLNGEVCNKALIRCAVRQSANGDTASLTDAEINSNPTIFLCKPLSQHICALYLRQLVSGLRYMHKRNLVHHDIKPDNILVGTNHHVFLSDFGVSEILSTRHEVKNAVKKNRGSMSDDLISEHSFESDGSDSTNDDGAGSKPRLGGGTLLFTAPELFDSSVNKKLLDPHLTDVWALGVTLYCMLVGMSPFFGNTYADVRANILTQRYPWCGKTIYGTPLAAEWRVVLNGLLAKNPNNRWSLARLKSFLDQHSFQYAMRQSAFLEASTRTRSLTSVDGDASPSTSTAQRAAGLAASSTGTFAKGLKLPLACSSVAKDKNASIPLPRVVSSPRAVSALSMEAGSAARSFLWDLGVSEKEVRGATRTVKVEVVRQTTVLSAHTRTIVRRYVEWIRACMHARNFIPLGCAPPLSRKSHAGSLVSMQMCADANKSSKTLTASREKAHVTHVPVLAVAARCHRTSEAGPIGTRSSLFPARRSPHSPAGDTRKGRQRSGSRSSNDGGGRALTRGSLESRASDGRLQSLDAALSIVNLQSTFDEHSLTFSLTSSSASSQASFSSQHGHSGQQPGRETRTNNGILAGNLATPSEDTPAPRNGMADKVSWCNAQMPSTVAQTMVPSSATPSSIAEEDSRKRVGAKGSKSRFQQFMRRKKTPSGASVSDDLTSYQSTFAPKSNSAVSPLLDSVLCSGISGLGDSNSAGCCSTHHNPKTVSTTDRCLAAPPDEHLSVVQSPGSVGNKHPVGPMQERLSDGKLAVLALTSFEQVPHVTVSKRLSSVFRK
ncbi:protein kinase, putative [Leishmania donovani]|uniref:non-specific serine/threonine protein kinase n=1 Tax=Leishmania donovani TaxID=5661 RepID=A0A3Q8II10_LEIDO|nr:protein kinase, putative [Leishmania donovani]